MCFKQEQELKVYNFKMDDWAIYSPMGNTYEHTPEYRCVILEVLSDDPFYDYKIFIDVRGIIRNVRESDLFPYEQTK